MTDSIVFTSPTDDSDTDGMFIRVGHDRSTGNTLIALDSDALDGLLTILDAADLQEMCDNPSYLGMDAETADVAATVGYQLLAQLKRAGVQV